MQMLQQFFGVEGARYVAWLLTAVALVLLALFLWWLIRKALGDRINLSDRADRRGRPPRLGVTETFNIGPQGRRLVMVRRDNIEHLIMIGGPNDVVIETNVVRGERPSVGRPEVRATEPEPMLAPLPQAVVSEPVPVVVPTPAVTPPPVSRAPSPAPVAVAPVLAPLPQPIAPTPVATPLPTVTAEVIPDALEAAQPSPRPGATLADRLKAGLSIGQAAPKVVSTVTDKVKAEATKVADVVKAEAPKIETPKVELPKLEVPKVEAPRSEIAKAEVPKPDVPKADMPAPPSAADFRQRIEDVVAAKMPPMKPVTPPPPPAAADIAQPPPVAKPAIAVQPPVPPVPPSPNPPAPPVAASKNPFDSLEEEMARLLGRAPDGKG